jgi:acetyl-CoA C-acetyltransferase
MNPLFDSAQVRTEQMSTSNTSLWDPRRQKLLPDVYIAMGQTAENLATSRGISRQEQDEFAVRSQNLAEKAIAYGFWQRDITPVARPDGTIVDRDDGPRAGVTFEAVANLPPVFRPGRAVTAGNCSPLNDGAAALIVFSDRKARDVGITPLARIVSTGVSALSPEIMGLGPVDASRQALTRAGMTINDIDLVEINEAFAAQVIPSYQDLDRHRPTEGARRGHCCRAPVRDDRSPITTTLINGLISRDKTLGLETMCVGGGKEW